MTDDGPEEKPDLRHTEHEQRDRQAEQRMYLPEDRREFRARELIVLRQDLGAVARASLGLRSKLRLIAAAGSWVVRDRSVFIDECKGIARDMAQGALNALT